MISEDERMEAAALAIFKAFTMRVRGTRQAMREMMESARKEVEQRPRLLALAEATETEMLLIDWEAYAMWRWRGAEPDYEDDAAERSPLNVYWDLLIEKAEAWVDGTLQIQYPQQESLD
jgi:hypothetical protein